MIRRGTADFIADEAVHGSDIDDASVLRREHCLFSDRASDLKGSAKIHVQFTVELIVRNIFCRSDCARASVIHENVDAAKLNEDFIDRRIHAVGVRNIALNSHGFDAVGFRDFFCNRFNLFFATSERDNLCTLIRQGLGHLNSKPRGATRYKSHTTSQIKIVLHSKSSVEWTFST